MSNKSLNSFYINNAPIKLTEARRLMINAESWGILTEYYLESVKITNYKNVITSTATLRISDRSGQVTCVIKGPSVALLLGLTAEEWIDIEKMCSDKDQLYYRYFKSGINKKFNIEQRIFYNFCLSNQQHNVLFAKFRRCVNMRTKFKSDPLLEILELKKYDYSLLDLYNEKLQ